MAAFLDHKDAETALVKLDKRMIQLMIREPAELVKSFRVTPQQASRLYHHGAITLHGHSKKLEIKHAILQVTAREAKRIAGINAAVKDPLPGAEDCKTSRLSGRTWSHIAAACSSYGPENNPVVAAWV